MISTAEELRDASRTLPKAIFWGVILNSILGYLTVFTLCFTITDLSALLSTATGYPFIQLFFNVTGSYAGTNVMAAIIVITLVCAVIAEIATASRQIWSFARDKGLPFSDFLSTVSPCTSSIDSLKSRTCLKLRRKRIRSLSFSSTDQDYPR